MVTCALGLSAGAAQAAPLDVAADVRVVERPTGGVRVEWTRAAGPPGLAGWHVERREPDGRVARISAQRVEPGLFDPPSAVYGVEDAGSTARAGEGVSYRLVTVDLELREHAGAFASHVVEPAPVDEPETRKPGPPLRTRAKQDEGPLTPGDRIRIAVTNAGLFRVSAAQVAAGLAAIDEAQAVQAILATNLMLSSGGEPVAWRAEEGGTGLLFFGEPLRDTYDRRGLYWLEPGPGLAMAAEDRSTPDTLADPWFRETVRVEQDLHFQPYLPGSVDDDYWIWAGQQVTSPSVSWSWNTSVPMIDPHPGERAGLVTAFLVSAYDGSPALDNRTRLTAAGQLLDDRQWAGNVRLAQSGTATNLSGASVAVSLEIRREAGVTTTTVLIDAIEVEYARRMRALNDQLLFRPEPGDAAATVRGFSSAGIRVFDVSDPLRPVELEPTIAPEGAEWRASWSVPPADLGRFLAAAGAAAPAGLQGVADRGWGGARAGAPHVVIAPRALTNAAAALVAHRIQSGLNSILVPMEDLFDEFAHGRRDPRAIPRFLAQAVDAWTVPPDYVCLAGDGHVDYQDVHNQSLTRPNHIPPMLDRVPYDSSPTGTEVALGLDNPLADLDGAGAPDLVIGRLPAQTAAALTRMINRIIAHEASDAWKSKVLLVSDKDVDDAFAAASGRLAAHVPAGMSIQRVDHTLSTSAGTMRTNFTRAMNSGPLLSVYFGHANNVGISSPYFFEHSFVRSHMSTLTNAARTPVVLAGTCMLNNFSQPHPDNRCLGKGFLDTAPGGAVAVWASAAESTLSMAEATAQAVFDELFADHDGRLGDLIWPALDLQAVSASPWTVRSSVLLGDPGQRIRTHLAPPEERLDLSAEGTNVLSGASGERTLEVTANVAWTAVSGVAWITVTAGSGSGDGTVVFEVGRNPDGVSRTGTVVVAGGGVSATYTIVQAARRDQLVYVRGISSGLTWFVDDSGDRVADRSFEYAVAGDRPVVGDIDGDGVDDIAITRHYEGWLVWHCDATGNGSTDLIFAYGVENDRAVVGDIDGDGRDDIAITRDYNGMLVWHCDLTGNGATDLIFVYGEAGDQAVIGDFNGDGVDDFAITRPYEDVLAWHVDLTRNGSTDLIFAYGEAGDLGVAGVISEARP